MKAHQTIDVPQSVADFVLTPAPPTPEQFEGSEWNPSDAEQDYASAFLSGDSIEESIFEQPALSHQSSQAEQLHAPSSSFFAETESFEEASELAPTAASELPWVDAEDDERIEETTDPSDDSPASEVIEAPASENSNVGPHSSEEWPVLMVPARRGSFNRVRASMVILTLLVSAAAIYFFIYRPLSSGNRGQTPANRSVGEASAAVAPESAPAPQAEVADPKSAEPTEISQPKAEAAAHDKKGPSMSEMRGQFSLQAAAFPVESGAEEFAEKLRRTGLPAYVVSADVAKRGRWYRVRVGRFETAEEAKRYSAEAQLRSKASGVSLQLIVCPYEQQ